jgi:hypothetical protein
MKWENIWGRNRIINRLPNFIFPDRTFKTMLKNKILRISGPIIDFKLNFIVCNERYEAFEDNRKSFLKASYLPLQTSKLNLWSMSGSEICKGDEI